MHHADTHHALCGYTPCTMRIHTMHDVDTHHAPCGYAPCMMRIHGTHSYTSSLLLRRQLPHRQAFLACARAARWQEPDQLWMSMRAPTCMATRGAAAGATPETSLAGPARGVAPRGGSKSKISFGESRQQEPCWTRFGWPFATRQQEPDQCLPSMRAPARWARQLEPRQTSVCARPCGGLRVRHIGATAGATLRELWAIWHAGQSA